MNKKELTERDICSKFITPNVVAKGWDLDDQVREEVYFTAGRVQINGNKVKRGEAKKADYILYYKSNLPIAVIEAKDNNHPITGGLSQAIEYGQILDIPFVYSSNGDGFVEHDFTKEKGKIERELTLNEFPTPIELWDRYRKWKGIDDSTEKIIQQEYYSGIDVKEPRYYQRIAINKVVEAIAKGQDRILLVMATGTGKTFVASQIMYRLWKAKQKKRILFLADRNILIDQAKNNDFKVFGGAMTKVTKRKVGKAHEIYLALYQGLSGNEDWKNIYKQFSKDFFDLVIVDECHRGSAKEDSAWREILTYFSNATQIGMTATPKETKNISNINYFGEPIYTYSLKQGINDGYLAPYKVIRIAIDKDVEGWRPKKGQKDKYGYEIPDRIYNAKDYDRDLVLDKRTEIVAKKVTEYLKNSEDRFAKTIIFCIDIDHAERMRMALINENSDLVKKYPKYVMKITGDDEQGKRELDNFIDPSTKFPTLVTTSKLLTTGVDAQTCKLVVLDTNIQSMTEFKQIIGRGSRIKEEYEKYYFTIMDFRTVTNLFADPEFDGDPVQIFETNSTEEIILPPVKEFPEGQDQVYIRGGETRPKKYYVNNEPAMVINERIQYYGDDGKLITESLKDYTKKKLGDEFASLDEFLQKWHSSQRKTAIIEELEKKGILLDELKKEIGKDLDDFDLISHIAFDRKPLTRKERADNVKKRNYFARYGVKAKQIIDALIDKYADRGITEIEDIKVLSVNPIKNFGTPVEIVKVFGGKDKYEKAINELEELIYAK